MILRCPKNAAKHEVPKKGVFALCKSKKRTKDKNPFTTVCPDKPRISRPMPIHRVVDVQSADVVDVNSAEFVGHVDREMFSPPKNIP